MTCEQIIEKRRVDFEQECVKNAQEAGFDESSFGFERCTEDSNCYKDPAAQAAWWGYNAALDSVEIELPPHPELKKGRQYYTKEQSAFHQGLMACWIKIKYQGFKVKESEK